MTTRRSLEDVERFLGAFEPAAPPDDVAARIRGRAPRARAARRMRVAALIGSCGIAAAACFAIVVAVRPPAPSAPPRVGPARGETLRTDLALRLIEEYRQELRAIDEMRQVIPPERAEDGRAVADKLDACMKRLAELENRVRLKPGSSRAPFETLDREKKVNV